jgi:hypothetical protein
LNCPTTWSAKKNEYIERKRKLIKKINISTNQKHKNLKKMKEYRKKTKIGANFNVGV